ncbi:hypothetical protein BV898_18559 [Hypsibius exemplaris]|uniref:Uncharacterized protein n=1 Tax=Hypsibius exemplaris TaxID=2072580 RepID=A0A9X6NK73_HYPEX|nr:hypothetical protein BV898_18559 [Hypsibius exemplaris]
MATAPTSIQTGIPRTSRSIKWLLLGVVVTGRFAAVPLDGGSAVPVWGLVNVSSFILLGDLGIAEQRMRRGTTGGGSSAGGSVSAMVQLYLKSHPKQRIFLQEESC